MRILFFVHPGTNSRAIFQDMIRGFRQAGHETILWEAAPIAQMYARHPEKREALKHDVSSVVAALIKSNDIDLSIAMWANAIFSLANGRRHGEPATFFDIIDEPHLMFWLDAPQWAADGVLVDHARTPIVAGQRVHHLVNNPATAEEMRGVLGFSNVHSRPYAINEEIFRSHNVPREFDIVFALGPGDPPPTDLMRRELECDEPDIEAIRAERAEQLLPQLHQLARQASGIDPTRMQSLLEALLRSQIDDRDTPMLDRLHSLGVDDLAEPAAALRRSPRLFVDATARIRQVESWERAFTISFLSRRLRCAVFGGGALDAWDYQGEHLGELPYDEQAVAYSRARLALNVMRQQDDLGVNIKPLEISASGTPCLMRNRPGIDAVLEPGEQIVTFDSPAAALHAARELLADDDRREHLAIAARTRVLAEHTWTHRAGDILNALNIPRRSDRQSM